MTPPAFRKLREMKPMRQIEIAEIMCTTRHFSVGYAKCLAATTPPEQLIDGEQAKELRGVSADEIERMEHETESLGREFKVIEETHGKNTLNLILVVGYLRKILDNARVARYFSQHHPEIHVEFQKLVESRSLADGAA
ncbi:plasmid partitioning protein RepB C-terminal domain-containing protein [Anatilimnocola sp. NA78]|uniref:plasmid partitioning protein RepB C-terminal domain-containing protein n=1 Tax=Anatilimnocola sp. NA78 TaxID=3415683 RepID=UPI003CE44D50